MAHYRDYFPSEHLSAADLAGDTVVRIIKYSRGEVGVEKQTKLLLWFAAVPKALCLNVTNADRISAMYGSDVDGWIGQEVTLYPSECDFKGKTVPCIRVRPQRPAPAAALPNSSELTALAAPTLSAELAAQFQQFLALQAASKGSAS